MLRQATRPTRKVGKGEDKLEYASTTPLVRNCGRRMCWTRRCFTRLSGRKARNASEELTTTTRATRPNTTENAEPLINADERN